MTVRELIAALERVAGEYGDGLAVYLVAGDRFGTVLPGDVTVSGDVGAGEADACYVDCSGLGEVDVHREPMGLPELP
jgi:hypothetical protein